MRQQDKSEWIIRSAQKIEGVLRPPGDKSISHRAILLGGIAEGESVVEGVGEGEDLLSSLKAIEALGAVTNWSGDVLTIQGRGWKGLSEPFHVIDCGNSGTTARFLLGILSGRPFRSTLTGDPSLRSRPMRRVTEPLSRMGARLTGPDGASHLPITVEGGALRGIDFRSPVASAQVKSALLLAGLQAEGETRVEEPIRSRDHTERMLPQFGVELSQEGNRYALRGGQILQATRLQIPADPSAAAFFVVAALLLDRSWLKVKKVCVNRTRTGLLEVLTRMGGKIRLSHERIVSGEPVADITVESSPLKGVEIGGEEVPAMIDEFPIFCVAAARAEGVTLIRGAEELRYKESDRISAIANQLRRFGVRIEERRDGLMIYGGARLQGARCQSEGDHRIAMAMAIAGLLAEGETRVEGVDCVRTSYPGFWDDLQRLVVNSNR